MISGHLSAKAGKWYMVLELRAPEGKRIPKWIGTGLSVKGNKHRAEEMLYQKRLEYSAAGRAYGNMLFSEYLEQWIEGRQCELAKATFDSYQSILKGQVIEFYAPKRIALSALKPADIIAYHQELRKRGVSESTVLRHHAVIHKALEDAYYHEMIPTNPAARVRRPRKAVYVTKPYTTQECRQLLDAIQEEKLEPILMMAVYTGMRRGELLGLRWGAIDFTNNILNVQHEVIRGNVNGRTASVAQDKLKRTASLRTLPMVEPLRNMLLAERQRRYEENSAEADDYIFVDKKGQPLKPNYITEAFPKLLAKHGLRLIRLHDLRHSCANLLITARTPLIEVQQWLGHSSIQTTADLYSHLTFQEKLSSAETIKNFNEERGYDMKKNERMPIAEWVSELNHESLADIQNFLSSGALQSLTESDGGCYDAMVQPNAGEPLFVEVNLDAYNCVADLYCTCNIGFCIHLATVLHEINARHASCLCKSND
ncbi:tyrosine-type recombinase/integrase [Butyricicoccus sp. Marseille-Q5471]|uniref:tyrosine-type recombinase/integrase n=1 Tax=Butyricicoccus sp. Marseille-Q5471 TaxID=3039493 RepID=UPI0024BD3118|nr:site-specific integrase [Butyricicoccus sp. Marseille-Q5471]